MGFYGTYYSDYCNKPSCLYRLYDASGDLLYVGISLNHLNRITRHRRQHWGPRIARYTVEWFPNREAAKTAERHAIHHEDPIYNRVRPKLVCC